MGEKVADQELGHRLLLLQLLGTDSMHFSINNTKKNKQNIVVYAKFSGVKRIQAFILQRPENNVI